MISGPIATMLLRDQGADVTEVEAPGSGSFRRYRGARSSYSPRVSPFVW